jgi:DNA polymerase-3 subunit gamma/tau
MAHQSLYRTYRPQVFGDVVGQDHVTRTLRNAVAEGSVAHAYLFSGPRGTGKTTTARILAKALDCEKGPTPDPDNTCESCREITEGRHPDVYELDAASRTGVDALRDEVISKVNYAATRGGYKVYIIDEVHMLSTSAFNALLKTLEEPPPKTVFVLCTTHPHKVPETIHSRCQRFDFRRIGTDDIVTRLTYIAREESIAVEPGALTLIARHAAGGMRDAIGTLDQLASFTGDSITVADVEGLLGEVDTARLFEAAGLLADRDVAGLFAFVGDLAESGHDAAEFIRALTAHVRDLYVTAVVADTAGIVDTTESDAVRLRAQAARFGMDRLARVLDELGRLQGELRWAPDARLALEIAFARIARPDSDITLESVAERVAALEAGTPVTVPAPAPAPAPAVPAREAGPAAGPAPSSTPGQVPAPAAAAAPASSRPAAPRSVEPVSTPAPERSAVPTVAAPPLPAAATVEAEPSGPAPSALPDAGPSPRVGGPRDVAELRRRWPDVIRAMKEARPASSKLFLETEPDLDGDTVVIEFDPTRKVLVKRAEDLEIVALVRRAVEDVLGWHVSIRYQLGRGAVRPPADSDSDAAAGDPPPPAGDPSAAGDRLDRMFIEGLGAEVVSDTTNDVEGDS